ncbi:unnamed protein product [Paramecium sonneborni]|uniref:Uncharacterized protein n=1 Tax=Paramecium sonneborni TaxID=65129 RepID=A0A8S1RPD1_9CILI|nr:unnamed protein product [Paramecium sonneborni]
MITKIKQQQILQRVIKIRFYHLNIRVMENFLLREVVMIQLKYGIQKIQTIKIQL